MNIIHSDDSILILNKPAGLPVLPEGWDKEAAYMVKQLEEEHGKIWTIHRLDKFTSGVIVFARTADAHRVLNGQFEKHEVEKIYHAIAVGVPNWNDKTTKRPLRVNVGHRHRTMVDDKNGKHSETRFKVLKRYPANVLLEARPMTGRTHQIRVHAYALGYPLLGDILYSAPGTDLIARPALHAYSLAFVHPGTDKRMTFTAGYPEDFQTALKRIAVPE
ncbi:MAG: RluA family pseudouridine synthase [Chloroflexota bacterium]